MAALAFYQRNPKTKLNIKGVLELETDGKIYVQTAMSHRPYKASLVTAEGHVLLANSEEFLKELSRQAKLSQLTFEYTEDYDKVLEYKTVLLAQQGGQNNVRETQRPQTQQN